MAVFTIGSSNLSGGSGSDPVSGGSALTTVGAVPYVSSSGVLAQDPTQLFWDATNNRLGIGIDTPSQQLHVIGNLMCNSNVFAGSVISGSTGAPLQLGANAASAPIGVGFVSTGNFAFSTGYSPTDGNYKLDVQKSGSTGTMRVWDQTATTGTTLAVVQAGQGQSGNLAEWRNYAGTAMHAVNSSGQLITATGTPASAAATGVAGTVVWDASFVYVCTATNTWKRVAIATW